jgi:hypothetical protein
MKKVINGKVYDTRTAKLCGEWDNGCYTTDFNFREENLYRKKTDEFFLHGRGGAKSIYATYDGDGWSGSGSRIIPMSEAAAKEWAEEHLSGDEYEDIFGEVDDSGEKVKISVDITPDQRKKLDDLKSATGQSISAIVAGLIDGL